MPAAAPQPADSAIVTAVDSAPAVPAVPAPSPPVIPGAVERDAADEFLDTVKARLDRRLDPTNQCTIM
jgi:hypothetical protein